MSYLVSFYECFGCVLHLRSSRGPASKWAYGGKRRIQGSDTRAASRKSHVASQSRCERRQSCREQKNRWISGWDRNPLARARWLSSHRDHDQSEALASRGVLLVPRVCVSAVKYKSSQTIQKRGDLIFHTPEHHETHTLGLETHSHTSHTH